MACQVYYKVRFRIEVVKFWLQSKHTLDPSVEKTYCVVTKHPNGKGSTYFLALCLYTNHLFHTQPPSFLHSITVRIHCTPQQKELKTHIFRFRRWVQIDFIYDLHLVSKIYSTKTLLSL
jgi:hypothetical protein